MSKSTRDSLSKDDIEEELINNDLMDSGGVEDQEHLRQMDLEDKKNLLRGINQSKDLQNEVPPKSPNQSLLEITKSNFPSLPLPAVGRNNTGARSKLKLPRKAGVGLAAKESALDTSPERTISLLDDEPEVPRFSLPFCVDDGAPPLSAPDRPLRHVDNPYFVMEGETPAAAMKRMLAHHKCWKEQYEAEVNRLESRALDGDEDETEQNESPRNDWTEEKNDAYDFVPDSQVSIPSKVYPGPRKRETIKVPDNTPQANTPRSGPQSGSRTLQRKASRDSDCEEIEPVLKPDEPKLSDWMATTPRSRGKRNRKQMSNHEKSQTEGAANVEFDFDNKWDSKSSLWRGQTPGSSSLNNQGTIRRSLPSIPVVEEEKVQCPICQRNFGISKVENHAATCEGYSGSPMDVEEES